MDYIRTITTVYIYMYRLKLPFTTSHQLHASLVQRALRWGDDRDLPILQSDEVLGVPVERGGFRGDVDVVRPQTDHHRRTVAGHHEFLGSARGWLRKA